MDYRPLTYCPECGGELDLTFAEEGEEIVCAVCGTGFVVLSVDPPDLDEIPEAND